MDIPLPTNTLLSSFHYFAQDIEFLEFALIHGSDRSQVPTDMLLVDSNVTLSFHNPSRYFHIEFSPTLLALSYLGVPIAHGKVCIYVIFIFFFA